MVYKRFSVGVTVRLALIILCLYLGLWLYYQQQLWLAPAILGIVALIQIGELIYYVNSVNHKLARFLDSIRYNDFSSSFTSDSQMGGSFREVNVAFNEVMDVFKKNLSREGRANAFPPSHHSTHKYGYHIIQL
jgi:hypothetical protein